MFTAKDGKIFKNGKYLYNLHLLIVGATLGTIGIEQSQREAEIVAERLNTLELEEK